MHPVLNDLREIELSHIVSWRYCEAYSAKGWLVDDETSVLWSRERR